MQVSREYFFIDLKYTSLQVTLLYKVDVVSMLNQTCSLKQCEFMDLQELCISSIVLAPQLSFIKTCNEV